MTPVDAPAKRTGRRGALTPVSGHPRITVHAAVGAILENQVLAHDVMRSTRLIHNAAMTGNRALVLNEAGRLHTRAVAARDELRRLASEIES